MSLEHLQNILKEKNYITIPELAKLLGISRIAVFKKVKKGHIEAIRIGRNFAISTDYIKTHIADIETILLKEEKFTETEKVINKAFTDYGEVFKRLGKH